VSQQILHRELAAGRWHKLSLVEQLGNIGSEVNRILLAKNNPARREKAVDRALELLDLTIADPRWKKRLKEITRARELFCSAVYGTTEYRISLEELNHYFFQFAFAARANK
jgi:hypothetical protein